MGTYTIGAGSYASYFTLYGPDSLLDNQGTIGGPTSSVAITVRGGGTIDNEAGGTVTGQFAISAYGPTTIYNSGTIFSSYGFGGGYGINIFEGGGFVKNTSTGVIIGSGPNDRPVSISGSGHATLENAGTIQGYGTAAFLYGTLSNLLIIDPGAVFNGAVKATFGTGTIELASGASRGALLNAGNKYTGFTTITVDPGARWDIVDPVYGVVAGFNRYDRFDLTGISPSGHVYFNSSTDVLTLTDPAGGVLQTLQLAGDLTGYSFRLVDDGRGGSFVEEQLATIVGTITTGVTLDSTFGDPLTVASTGRVTGGGNAITGSMDWTIVNQGTIQGGTGSGITLTAGGSVTNSADGAITGTQYGVRIKGAAGTLDNAGTITATGTDGEGVQLDAGGMIVNEGSGVITGDYGGAAIANAGTVVNFGSIGATGTLGAGVALYDGSTLLNHGSVSGETGVFISGGGIVSNIAGAAITGYQAGVYERVGLGTIDNAGTIAATGSGGVGVYLFRGGTITNEAGGTIVGADRGIFGGLNPTTLDNAGVIAGTQKYGVILATGGAVTNQSTGTISGYYFAVGGSGYSLSVGNAGTILSTGSAGFGVDLSAYNSTLVNTGAIIGGSYGAAFAGKYATLENAGTIKGLGGHAVYMNGYGGNRLIVDAGAVFDGDVRAYASVANTIELTSGATPGTLSGLGTEYIGFQTVTIDSGASWEIAGSVAGFGGVTVAGFTAHDKFDLTDLAFNAGDRVDLNRMTDVLTVRDSGGTVLATIQLAGDFSGDFFHLSNDGHGHTLMTEDTTPCFCRGTRIRTPGGDRPVETLRIGDLVTTAGGEALALKWIGRRSYRDWLAMGNPHVQPILFKAGALAERVPARDLYVSPEHAMFVDGMLVPACHLVNGVSILKMSGLEEIEYFHLEFDRHIVILAEGAAAESFVDDDSRMLFHNADEYRRLYPDEPPRQAEFCAPRVESGPALETLRRRLAARAARLRPDRKAAAAARRGYVDRATRALVEGWAQGDGPVRLAILVNGAVVGETLADRARADLRSNGLGDCGFRFILPQALSPALGHRIEVRRESDWSLLHGGPVMLRPAPGA